MMGELKKARYSNQLIAKFLGVGIVNTVIGYTIYAVLIIIGLPYLAALFIATVMGVIFNYINIGRLVFKSPGGIFIFIKFVTTYVLVYFINAAVLDAIIQKFQVGPFIGQVLCMPPSVILSWLLMNYWVYKND